MCTPTPGHRRASFVAPPAATMPPMTHAPPDAPPDAAPDDLAANPPYSPVGRVYPSAANAANAANGAGGAVVLFDPPGFFELCPLSLTRPAFGLRCGIGTLLDNQIRHLRPAAVTLWVRPALEAVARRLAAEVGARHGVGCDVNRPLGQGRATLVDGRTWWFAAPPPVLPGTMESDETRQPLRWVLERPGLTPERFYAEARDARGMASGLVTAACPARVLRRWWDLLAHNEAALRRDADDFALRTHHVLHPPPGAYLVRPERVHVGRRVAIAPGVVLDAEGGPICLDDGASVGAGAVLIGPCYVGPGSTVSPHATLRPGTNVGPVCKVGGEIGNAIFQGHANKAHDGYLGDSYVGEWANLGAGTTTSNLKNTYGPVRAATPAGRVDTGRTFVGSVIGDHAKLGIGTMLAAGSHVGVGSQVSVARPPQFVGHLRFVTPAGDKPYAFAKFVETARRVVARRGMTLSDADVALLRGVAADD